MHDNYVFAQFSLMFNIIPAVALSLIGITNATGVSANVNSFQVPRSESLTTENELLLLLLSMAYFICKVCCKLAAFVARKEPLSN